MNKNKYSDNILITKKIKRLFAKKEMKISLMALKKLNNLFLNKLEILSDTLKYNLQIKGKKVIRIEDVNELLLSKRNESFELRY